MREVIDYSKDFLSGETIERKRNKEDLNYRGIATVQLFDEKGNVVQEVKSENMINSKWLSYLYKSFFCTQLIKNNYAFFFYGNSPAQYMILSDNSEAEELNEVVKGNCIGWADGWKTYSGSDVKRGTLNTAETNDDDFRKHFVIDFPTHAANGTFQSIYWLSGHSVPDDYEPSYSVFKEDKILCKMGENNPIFNFVILDDYIYGYANNSKPTEFNKVDAKTYKVVRSIENNDITNDYVDVGIGNGNIYFFTNKYANVYDKDLNFIEKINFTPLDSSTNIRAANVTCFENGFIIRDDKKFYLYDFSMNEVRSIPYLTDLKVYTSRDFQKLVYLGDGIFNYGFLTSTYYNNSKLTSSMYYYDVNKDEGYIWLTNRGHYLITKDNRDPSYSYEQLSKPFYDWTRKRMYFFSIGYDKGNYLFECVRIPWFSHTLLPAPVTKTATNTMKIQYDFVVEERGYFD